MPIPLGMMDSLIESGYREISIRSCEELIAGCRYVSIKTVTPSPVTASETPWAIQLMPNQSLRPNWSIWDWSWDEQCAIYKRSSTRSNIEVDVVENRSVFGLPSSVLSGNPVNEKVAGSTKYYCTFKAFVSGCYRGVDNQILDHVASLFNRKHPTSYEEQVRNELQRQREEVSAREARLNHREAFEEVSELRAIAAQYAARGDSEGADAYLRAAESLRERVQGRLDRKEPIVRENIQVNISRLRPIARIEPRKAEIVETKKRSIILEP